MKGRSDVRPSSSPIARPVVLVVAKDAASRGGVAAYFRLFFAKWSHPVLDIERFEVGSRAGDYANRRRRRLAYMREYGADLRRFRRRLLADARVRIVQVNPSLIPVPLLRDGLLVWLARRMQRRTVVCFRGWKDDVAAQLARPGFRRRLFLALYGRADLYVVLAESFAGELVRIGLDPLRLRVSRTMYDGALVLPRVAGSGVPRFLFLSRISTAKGVMELVKAAAVVRAQGLDFRLSLHGHAADDRILTRVRTALADAGLDAVCNVGEYLDGQEKYATYAAHDVLVLPSHHEGCPNTVLEGLGAGMFVLASRVGAIPEVVEHGVNGWLTAPRDVVALAEGMAWCIRNVENVRARADVTRQAAASRFEARIIVRQMSGLYEELLAGSSRAEGKK